MTSHKLNPADCLPPELFDKVMFLVGSHDIESLLICRLVCKEWKKKIMDSLWENPSKKWGTIIGRRFEDSWEFALPTEAKLDKATELVTEGILPSAVMERLAKKLRKSLNTSYQGHDMQVQEVKCAASLAHKGLLGSHNPISRKFRICQETFYTHTIRNYIEMQTNLQLKPDNV